MTIVDKRWMDQSCAGGLKKSVHPGLNLTIMLNTSDIRGNESE